jgi:hypothetical protein
MGSALDLALGVGQNLTWVALRASHTGLPDLKFCPTSRARSRGLCATVSNFALRRGLDQEGYAQPVSNFALRRGLDQERTGPSHRRSWPSPQPVCSAAGSSAAGRGSSAVLQNVGPDVGQFAGLKKTKKSRQRQAGCPCQTQACGLSDLVALGFFFFKTRASFFPFFFKMWVIWEAH